MYAIRLIGNSWYRSHAPDSVGSSRSLNEAMLYATEEGATTAAMILTMAHPQWMRKVRIQRVICREIRKIKCLNPAEKNSNRRCYKQYKVEHWVTV